jgi:hypothetical protein
MISPAFQGHGWISPRVLLNLTSDAPVRTVYEYYSQQAIAAGWTPTNIGPLGVAITWQKRYANGALGSLVFVRVGGAGQAQGSAD